MKPKLSRKALTIIIVLLTFSYFPCCQAQNYTNSYQLLNEPSGSTNYRLTITIQQSLYEYYLGQTHTLSSEEDFAKFVTPHALKPIADSLREIYAADDENFANGVLMITHQIPYTVTDPIKYPVETLVENRGDCDLFSCIAASIMKAGGLDVVLLYYEDETHMNLGVNLPNLPRYTRGQFHYVLYNNIKYYMAECTGGEWQDGWRVGECPNNLKEASVKVITLENCEQWSPGQVSASYKALISSTITLTASSTFFIQGSTATLSGQLSPALQNENITIYISVNNSPWTVLGVTTTNSNGHFQYVWNIKTPGICLIRANWSGNSDYAGADSPIQTVTVMSTFFILLLVVTVVLVCVGAFVFIISRQSRLGPQEPSPPEIPFYQKKLFTS